MARRGSVRYGMAWYGRVGQGVVRHGMGGSPLVTACLVTRGDHDLQPVLESLPSEWEKIVWDNGAGAVRQWTPYPETINPLLRTERVKDLAVYGRYAAIEHASHDLIYVQDDDVIVCDPQELVDAWDEMETLARIEQTPDSETAFLVANMPQEFRHDGYTDSCLVGFGACFHRDAPARAFERWYAAEKPEGTNGEWGWISRTCDVIFTTLTPRVLVDVPKVNREFAEDEGRMYRTSGHVEERARMLELARQVRDA